MLLPSFRGGPGLRAWLVLELPAAAFGSWSYGVLWCPYPFCCSLGRPPEVDRDPCLPLAVLLIREPSRICSDLGAVSKHLQRCCQPVLRNFRQGPAPLSPAHQGGHVEWKNAPPEWPNQLPHPGPPGGGSPCGELVVTRNVF
jgi:hypothetical protein